MLIESVQYPTAHVTNSGAYRLAPDVILLRIQDGSARLLNLRGNFYALSQSGAQMLEETLREGFAPAALHIATAYRTDVSRVQNDLHAFLHDLEQKQLIQQVRRHQDMFQKKNIWPRLVLLPVLRLIFFSPLSLEKKSWTLLTLAAVAIRLFGWPGTVANWHSSLQKYAPRGPAAPLEPSIQEIDQAVRSVAAGHPFHVECKERALCCWWLLSAAGFSPTLVIGVGLFPLACHCWCETGQFVVSDDQDRCAQFVPILSYSFP